MLYYHTLPPFFHPLSFPLYSTPMHFLFVWCRYHIQYTDGEEENLTQDEIIPLLSARDCSERITKHHKASWVRDAYGKLLSWADHPDGGSWVDTCCCPECEGGWYCFCYSIFCCLLQYLMFYVCFLLVLQWSRNTTEIPHCPNSQHEECVFLSYPGSHPKVSLP